MIKQILSITLPIFSIVLVGFIYGRVKKPNMTGANQVIIDLALPCLIFTSLSAKQFELTSASLFVLSATIVVIFSGLLIWPLAKYSGTGAKALLPSVMFGNVGPIGIPITVLAFGPEGLAPAILILVFSNILHFSVGVGIMSGRVDAKLIYASPLVWATILGILFSYLQLSLPDWVGISVSMIGTILVPLMLLSLGTRLADSKIEHLKVGAIGSILSIISRLLITYIVLMLVPLEPIQKGALILFAGLPPAVFNYMFADRYKQEPDKVASIVIVGHLLSLLVLPLVLWLAL
ncbi:COG0679 Predicted permeases [Candidatus Pelagibacterales bacterium]|jgi:malate permease and related proteins